MASRPAARTTPEIPRKVRRSPASWPTGQDEANRGRARRNRPRSRQRMTASKRRSTTAVPTAKPGPDALLPGQVDGLGQLSQAAGEESADGKAEDLGRQEIAEADVELLLGHQDLPAEGPGQEMEAGEEDGQEEEGHVDVGDLGGDVLPLDAAPEEIEQNDGQDGGGADLQGVRLHGREPSYHEAREPSTGPGRPRPPGGLGDTGQISGHVPILPNWYVSPEFSGTCPRFPRGLEFRPDFL